PASRRWHRRAGALGYGVHLLRRHMHRAEPERAFELHSLSPHRADLPHQQSDDHQQPGGLRHQARALDGGGAAGGDGGRGGHQARRANESGGESKMKRALALLLLTPALALAQGRFNRGVKIHPGVRLAQLQIQQVSPYYVQGQAGAKSATFDQPNTAGRQITALVGWQDGTHTISTIADSAGNAYTRAGAVCSYASGG